MSRVEDPEWPDDIEAQVTLLREIAPSLPNAPRDLQPWDFLDRLPAGKRAALRPVLLRLFDDESWLVRELALAYCVRLPADDATFAKLLALARLDPGSKTRTLQHALASLAHTHEQRRDAARAIKRLVGAARPVSLIPAVVHDPDWLIELARAHAATDDRPSDWVFVAGRSALYRRQRLLELLGVLADLASDDACDTLDEVACELGRDPAQRAELLGEEQLVDPGVIVTVESCRKALRIEPLYLRIEGDPGEAWLVEAAVEALAELGVALPTRRTVVATSARSAAYGGESVRSHRYRLGTEQLGLEVETALEEWVADDAPEHSGASPQRRPGGRAQSLTAGFAANSTGRPRRLSVTLEARGLRPSRRLDGGIWRLEGPDHIEAHAWFWIGGPPEVVARTAARIRARCATTK